MVKRWAGAIHSYTGSTISACIRVFYLPQSLAPASLPHPVTLPNPIPTKLTLIYPFPTPSSPLLVLLPPPVLFLLGYFMEDPTIDFSQLTNLQLAEVLDPSTDVFRDLQNSIYADSQYPWYVYALYHTT